MQSKRFGGVVTLAAAAGAGYLAFALHCVRKFRLREHPPARRLPSVAVLKPLYGAEEGLEENLVSFCKQDYPWFDVIFGVHDSSDPAADVARRVVERFPERARLVAGEGSRDGINPKVENLLRMAGGVSEEIVVLADADMRAAPSYLRSIVAPFDDERVGAVTCLYAGSAQSGTASELAAMFVNEQFAPSVLVANAVEPLRYAFGATIAVRRSLLERIGGFSALLGHVADDHLLGKLVNEAGFEVRLSTYVVENVMYERDFSTLWARELRWSRTIRSVRPLGHAFSVVTFGLPLAVLAVGLRPGLGTGLLLGVTAGLRYALHVETQAAFGVGPKAASALLIPLRDALSLAVWVAAFCGRDVDWRGRSLQLDPEGQILS